MIVKVEGNECKIGHEWSMKGNECPKWKEMKKKWQETNGDQNEMDAKS